MFCDMIVYSEVDLLEDHCVTQCWKTKMIAVPIFKLSMEAMSGSWKGQDAGDGWSVKPDYPVSQEISNNFHWFWYRVAMDSDVPIGFSNILQ